MRSTKWTGVALATLLAACADGPIASRPLHGLPRALTAAEQKVVAGSNGFAFGLLRTAPARQGNVFVSPLGVSMALGMAMSGARGATRDEMGGTLGFAGMSPQEVDGAYRSLIDLLLGLDGTTDVRLASSVWYRQGFPFDAAYLDATRASFGAQVTALDFGDPAARDRINAWVREGTGGKIPGIVDGISADQVMFLVNAVYFKGRWAARFDRAATRDQPFHRTDATTATVPMMSREGTYAMASGAGWQALDLPYGNGAFSMTVVLPAQGTSAAALAARMDAAAWDSLTAALRPTQVMVKLPRFRIDYGSDLAGPLQELGMRRAFTGGGADFTGMSASRGHELFISAVQHRTFVDVDEEGTEAAAATSVGVNVTSLPPSFVVDRPFLVAIRERFSGTILFLGRIEDPRQS
ncbi:MAG TPA: serpin family protein [Longimicrobiaceae bacterium]|nr:serpin family protein [Longimicrobiaceae bacterium]